MTKKLDWYKTLTGCAALLAASTCLAGVQALDDHALTEVHGAGMDTDIMGQLGKGQSIRSSSEAQRRQASSPQNTAALLAALDLQTRQSTQTAVNAVNAVQTAAQLGGTLVALTPIAALVPIGLPLFGLPNLPPPNNNR
jgi:hypothetical protein